MIAERSGDGGIMFLQFREKPGELDGKRTKEYDENGLSCIAAYGYSELLKIIKIGGLSL